MSPEIWATILSTGTALMGALWKLSKVLGNIDKSLAILRADVNHIKDELRDHVKEDAERHGALWNGLDDKIDY